MSKSLPHWVLLYNDFVLENDPHKLRALLDGLEAAMYARFLELHDRPYDQGEAVALRQAATKLLEIKESKLDSLSLNS
jgi:hypothetical protein